MFYIYELCVLKPHLRKKKILVHDFFLNPRPLFDFQKKISWISKFFDPYLFIRKQLSHFNLIFFTSTSNFHPSSLIFYILTPSHLFNFCPLSTFSGLTVFRCYTEIQTFSAHILI